MTRSKIDRTRGVDFHALVVPETVYVGQQATYQLGVFLDQETRQRIRRNPEFQPPETRSLLSYDLRESVPSVSATVDGRPYEAHVFRRALFPLTPGRYPIPQARLTYALPQTASFFSREENFTLRSEAVAFVAIEPPTAGRPADWAGAVGVWRASASIDTARGRAGEPFVLTLRIEGQGNVTLLPRPRVTIDWATVVTADERVRLDSTPALLGGWKEFDWLVTPMAAGGQRVPALRYTYFNPRARRYESASSSPFDVRVAPGDAVAEIRRVTAPVESMVLPLRAAIGDAVPDPIGTSPLVIALLLTGPMAALGIWFARRPRRVRPAPTPQQRLAALGDRADHDAVREARRSLVEGLRARTGLNATALTAPGAWTQALRKSGVSAESAAAIEALVEALDSACFSDTQADWSHGEGWSAQAREALRIVDAEACALPLVQPIRWSMRSASVVAVWCIASAVVPLPVFAQGTAADAFAMGSTAYAGGDYLRAERYFADAAREAPRSVAAWANLGSSAFLAHDTATAVVGWQRALRLNPTNSELRALLSQVRAPQESGFARVPRLPGRWMIAAALLMWIVGWGLTARQSWRRRPAWRRGLLTTFVGGTALLGAYRIERALQGNTLVVVTAPTPLRAVPALGAEARATPMVGEVASVRARKGLWVHIRLDGAREGWIPEERLTRLGNN
ncbi:MAG: hypothetical protein O2973_07125 [Gemmatimonadetes bacterium]|nr:hypothetical protein [Gemmatimonadota bacterium]